MLPGCLLILEQQSLVLYWTFPFCSWSWGVLFCFHPSLPCGCKVLLRQKPCHIYPVLPFSLPLEILYWQMKTNQKCSQNWFDIGCVMELFYDEFFMLVLHVSSDSLYLSVLFSSLSAKNCYCHRQFYCNPKFTSWGAGSQLQVCFCIPKFKTPCL